MKPTWLHGRDQSSLEGLFCLCSFQLHFSVWTREMDIWGKEITAKCQDEEFCSTQKISLFASPMTSLPLRMCQILTDRDCSPEFPALHCSCALLPPRCWWDQHHEAAGLEMNLEKQEVTHTTSIQNNCWHRSGAVVGKRFKSQSGTWSQISQNPAQLDGFRSVSFQYQSAFHPSPNPLFSHQSDEV